ncbi:hypothetical protein N658DRAFT_518025 [Parathielavia hyrcaniae]|uniref:Uncharacterized protein n=1 Tax=Parathielavia hyrcaniae TaxID=113614 RepID=A0AAN6SYE1_9PEZI|nr:hypothetical protein N658DRAFT_518025 [Parathielavia hyrcaniae]
MTTVFDLLLLDPINPVFNEENVTTSNKEWASRYHPLRSLIIHTQVGPDGRADCELWFHTEVSNVVLAAWTQYGRANISEEVDAMYGVDYAKSTVVLAIGEMKRNLIRPDLWQSGNPSGLVSQQMLSRELRGYAYNYQCPQVYCFDGETLILLQFQAQKPDNILEANCPVDCWVLPRIGSAVPLRYALYRLLAQGFRRFQRLYAPVPAASAPVGGLKPFSRMFYNGWPVWKTGGTIVPTHSGGYEREVDAASEAVKWTHPDPANDELVWETTALWGEHA